MKNRGYTLIELIVSVAIFSLVMLFVTTAYLSLIAATRHARATSTLMTNIDSTIDFMARSARTGTNFECGAGGDCAPPAGGSSFTFKDSSDRTITYLLSGTTLSECINIPSCTAASASPLTDPSINITSLKFFLRGTGTYTSGDRVQPSVVMVIQGSADVPGGAPVAFSIETGATERDIDIGS